MIERAAGRLQSKTCRLGTSARRSQTRSPSAAIAREKSPRDSRELVLARKADSSVECCTSESRRSTEQCSRRNLRTSSIACFSFGRKNINSLSLSPRPVLIRAALPLIRVTSLEPSEIDSGHIARRRSTCRLGAAPIASNPSQSGAACAGRAEAAAAGSTAEQTVQKRSVRCAWTSRSWSRFAARTACAPAAEVSCAARDAPMCRSDNRSDFTAREIALMARRARKDREADLHDEHGRALIQLVEEIVLSRF